MSDHVDTIVLGAGVAGLTAVDAVLGQGRSVLCLETFDAAGGLHRSRDIGPYTFDNGAIVFYPDFPLLARFPGLRDLCVSFPHSFQRVAPGGDVRAYPFETREAFRGGAGVAALNMLSLLRGRLRLKPPANVEEFCHRALGRRLYHRLGLRTYVERFYGVAAAELEPRFAQQRMGMIARAARLDYMVKRLANALRGREVIAIEAQDRADGLVRPLAGFPAFYGAAQAGLEARGAVFRFSTPLGSIRRDGEGFVVAAGEGEIHCARIISTVPVNVALGLIGEAPSPALRSSDLLTLYVSAEGPRGFRSPILYNFDAAGRWKRLTQHSAAYGQRNGRDYFSVEIPSLGADEAQGPAEFDAFRSHVIGAGVFGGDLRLEGYDVTHGAYPAYLLGSGAALARALARLEAFGLIPAGRQGRFDYLPTTWHVMSQVDDQLARAKAKDAPPEPVRAAHPVRAGESLEPAPAAKLVAN